jgi:hypothetical protein
MRDIIEGMFRIDPILVQTGLDKNTNKALYSDWNIGTDLTNVSYTA